MLCIGSSLEVYPVAELPLQTLAAGGELAVITHGPTPLDGRALVRLDGDVIDELGGAGLRARRSTGEPRALRVQAVLGPASGPATTG